MTPSSSPSSPSSLSSPLTQAELSRICNVVVCAALNDNRRLRTMLQRAFQHNTPHKQLYEALLQVYLHAGFPAALEGLTALADVYGAVDTLPEPYLAETFRAQGLELFQRIYTSAAEPMMQRLEGVSPDIREWMIIEGYGKMLCREGLSVQTRELLSVAVLASLGWQTQLYSHLRGALNVGVSESECQCALESLHCLNDAEDAENSQNAHNDNNVVDNNIVPNSILQTRFDAATAMLQTLLRKRQA